MRPDTPPQPHLIRELDPTGNVAARNVDRDRAGLNYDRFSAIAEFARAHPHATARAISRSLGNVSRRQVEAALRIRAD